MLLFYRYLHPEVKALSITISCVSEFIIAFFKPGYRRPANTDAQVGLGGQFALSYHTETFTNTNPTKDVNNHDGFFFMPS